MKLIATCSELKERLLKELKMAKRVQQALLLVESPNIEGIKIAKSVFAIILGVTLFIYIKRF